MKPPKTMREMTKPRRTSRLFLAVACVSLVSALACEDGEQGPPGPPAPPAPTPPTSTIVDPHDSAPALEVEILGISGASGSGGAFRVGDRVRVRFRMEHRDGTPWMPSEMTEGLALISGPTFSYQRVIPAQEDFLEDVVQNDNGTFSYTFPPLPAVYAAPYNDTPSFEPSDGERTGQPLLGGTYTAALSVAWRYTVEGQPFLRVGEASRDFVLQIGDEAVAAIVPREVTRRDNCNQCHERLQAHEGRYYELALCLGCHTIGAEDGNDPAIALGTPGVTISSRVLFHKLHNGKHLPSVNGVATFPGGSRNYAAPRRKLEYQAEGGVLRDFSSVGFPAFPERLLPMPRDRDYSLLAPAEQALEDVIRTGVTSCYVCHGDPDGTGPLPAPAQGDLIEVQPTRAACGACHDDVDFTKKYRANQASMDPQRDDSGCIFCHDSTFGGPLSVRDGHLHPLRDPSFNAGLNVELLDLVEAPGGNGNGALDPGEHLRVTFTLEDDSGAPLGAADIDRLRAVVSGPTANANILATVDVPPALLAGPQPFVIDLPERRLLEFVGDATGTLGDIFTTAQSPHLFNGAQTSVSVRIATGAPAFLTAAVTGPASSVDVDDTSGFARDDVVVLDDGVPGSEEYLRVQLVDGLRLWFSGPGDPVYAAGPRLPHALGASVKQVQLALKIVDVDYMLDAAAGSITEKIEFGAGNAVLVDYSAPFVLPSEYPAPLNASPDLGEEQGAWAGKPVVGGTYALGLWASRDKIKVVEVEDNLYTIASPPARREFQVEAGSPVAPYALIDSSAACQACHQDVMYHGGRERGFDTCLLCHGTAGAEDRPRYVAANAPETSAATVSFRTLLHKIHMGSSLENAATFELVGEGSAPWPDNFSLHDYATIAFPPMPGAAKHCAKCHGSQSTAWYSPTDRNHPTSQGRRVLAWTATCGACHDGLEATGHIEANVSPAGVESCGICHGPGEAEEVRFVHKNR